MTMLEKEEEEPVEGFSFSVAMRNARSNNADRRTKARFQRLKSPRRIRPEANKTLAMLINYISPIDDAVELQVSQMWKKHNEKHKEIFGNIEETKMQLWSISRIITLMRRRIAERHGWNGLTERV